MKIIHKNFDKEKDQEHCLGGPPHLGNLKVNRYYVIYISHIPGRHLLCYLRLPRKWAHKNVQKNITISEIFSGKSHKH